MDVRAFGSWMPAPTCFFSRILTALTEVLGQDLRTNDPRMSAGCLSQKLLLWADFSSLMLASSCSATPVVNYYDRSISTLRIIWRLLFASKIVFICCQVIFEDPSEIPFKTSIKISSRGYLFIFSEGNKEHPKTQHTRKRRKLTAPFQICVFVAFSGALCSPLRGRQNTPENATHPKTQIFGAVNFLRFRVCCVFGCFFRITEKGG